MYALVYFILVLLIHTTSSSVNHRDSTIDGNIPMLDVQLEPTKRWLYSNREFKNLQKELSFLIDKEIEKERDRLLEREDELFSNKNKKKTAGKVLSHSL